MYGRVIGVTVLGVGGHPVTVEAHVGRGLPSLILTGLPGAAVQDARDRIRPAVEASGFEWPLRRGGVKPPPGTPRQEGARPPLPGPPGGLAGPPPVAATPPECLAVGGA